MGCASGKLGTGVELVEKEVDLSLGNVWIVGVVGRRMGCMCVNLWLLPLLLPLVVVVLVDTRLVVLVEVCLVELVEVVVELGLVG